MKNTLLSLTLVAAACFGTGAWAAPTEAQTRIGTPHSGGRPLQLDLHGGFVWRHGGFSTGVRFGIPIVDNGFVSSINNAVYINFGGDLYFIRKGRSGVGLGLPVTLHWEFYFSDHWSAFGEAGINVFFGPRYWSNQDLDVDADWLIGAVGGRFWFNEGIAITLRLGSPYASFGVSFFF
jgi:hypothetical protein